MSLLFSQKPSDRESKNACTGLGFRGSNFGYDFISSIIITILKALIPNTDVTHIFYYLIYDIFGITKKIQICLPQMKIKFALKTYITRNFDKIEAMDIIVMMILTAFVFQDKIIIFCSLNKQKTTARCCYEM